MEKIRGRSDVLGGRCGAQTFSLRMHLRSYTHFTAHVSYAMVAAQHDVRDIGLADLPQARDSRIRPRQEEKR